ncbi:hypothetical protein C8R43DRAFT_253448 [Mycena crocata]|nr:hypothetical protein C8R43DRAFT_253448 [Mycena crocata]
MILTRWRFLQRLLHSDHCRAMSSFHNKRPTRETKEDAFLSSAVNWTHQVLRHQPERALSTTIWVHNLPPDVSVGQLLRLVLFGPLFRVAESEWNRARVISLTFFDNPTAVRFYQEMTNNQVILHGIRLKFAWGQGPAPSRYGTRALFIHDVAQLGPADQLHERLSQYGSVDRVLFTRQGRAAFVDFLAVSSAKPAVKKLRKLGVKVGFADDGCWTAGQVRAFANESRTRQVILTDMPTGTTVTNICDHICGGALEKILFDTERCVAFVHFVTHEAAEAFYRHALYHGIMIGDQRLSTQMKPDPPHLARLPPHLAHSIENGATRCLHLVGIPDIPVERIRHDFERFGTVERVEVVKCDGSRNALVSFTDIRDAIKAARSVVREPVRQIEVGFATDRCAAPFPGAQRTAQVLQAHIASFLTMPRSLILSGADG